MSPVQIQAESRSSAQPFARLDPNTVLGSLEAIGLRCDGRLQALNSFENRVYLIGLDNGDWRVVKFYRPGRWSREQLLEEHQFAHQIATAEIPLATPLHREELLAPTAIRSSRHIPGDVTDTLFESAGFFIAIYRRQGGRVPELDNIHTGPNMRARIGQFIARIHQIGARRPFRFRPALDCQRDGWASIALIAECGWLPPDIREQWITLAQQCCTLAEAHLHLTHSPSDAGQVAQIRLHGDCHPGNLLWTEAHGPHFVDLDDCCSGPAIQDLWMIADAAGQQDGGEQAQRQAMEELLEGYELIRPFNRAELSLIEALRTLRIIRHSAWLAKRWEDPAFPAAFPWFGSPRYWQGQIISLQEQLALLQARQAYS